MNEQLHYRFCMLQLSPDQFKDEFFDWFMKGHGSEVWLEAFISKKEAEYVPEKYMGHYCASSDHVKPWAKLLCSNCLPNDDRCYDFYGTYNKYTHKWLEPIPTLEEALEKKDQYWKDFETDVKSKNW